MPNTYDYIINPSTNRKVSIHSTTGKNILKGYLQQGGAKDCTGRKNQECPPDCKQITISKGPRAGHTYCRKISNKKTRGRSSSPTRRASHCVGNKNVERCPPGCKRVHTKNGSHCRIDKSRGRSSSSSSIERRSDERQPGHYDNKGRWTGSYECRGLSESDCESDDRCKLTKAGVCRKAQRHSGKRGRKNLKKLGHAVQASHRLQEFGRGREHDEDEHDEERQPGHYDKKGRWTGSYECKGLSESDCEADDRCKLTKNGQCRKAQRHSGKRARKNLRKGVHAVQASRHLRKGKDYSDLIRFDD